MIFIVVDLGVLLVSEAEAATNGKATKCRVGCAEAKRWFSPTEAEQPHGDKSREEQ